ncbi:CPSF A subunit region-domain-containing protein [Leucosporidium creatinivorum]|uniref:DNA damage-binding protein 1 n=1 Tax=Leucosporidium creatinivorum TaxID=106004 RepID=A0A1Y2FBF1_9BASI|nr:CPSF A subunit region-domain-containing protein [Leucosporidium creatinivorum]
MLYVASAQPATAQLGAFKCDFLVSGSPALVVNKLTRLEVYQLDEEQQALSSALEIPVNSTIAAATAVKLEGQATSSIIVLTTSLQLFSLSYSSTAPHILTTSTTSILEQFGRLSEYQTILVDPSQRCLLVHAYNGLVRIIPLTPPPTKARKGSKSSSRGSATAGGGSTVIDLSRGYNVRLPSLNVTSIAFLPPTLTDNEAEDDDPVSFPSIALIYSNHSGRKMLETHVVDLDEKELGDGPVAGCALEDPGSEMVIPVAGEDGEEDGVIVVGEESLSWVGLKKAESSKGKGKAGEAGRIKCRLPVGMIQAWTQVDGSPNRFLIGDIYGKLLAIEVVRSSSGKVAGLQTRDLGDTASPTSLVFLSDTLLYLSSRFGDSQLIRLPSSTFTASGSKDVNAMDVEGEEEEGIQLVASYASLAPILDCCVVEGEGGGDSHVVTCSGAYKGGSLRVVRQGVGLSELANLEMEGIQRLWSLKRNSSADELLVLGFFNETRILSLSSSSDPDAEDEIEEVDLPFFAADQATLLAAAVGDLLVQVTTAGVSFAQEDGSGAGKWSTEGGMKITLAAAAGEHVLLAVEGGVVVLLGVKDGQLVQLGTTQLDNEIACLDIAELGSQLVATVALWTLNTILLISLPTLSTIASQILTTTYLIRSVLLVTFPDGISTLFAGLGDGSLSSFAVDAKDCNIAQGSEKTVTLGTKPLVMSTFKQKGAINVFVSSDRPTVISRANDRLVYSSVNLKSINAFVPFSSSSYPSALALASPNDLRIGRIEDIQRVDIRAIPLDEDEPRRIAHDPKTRTFGVVCLRRDVNRETGEQTSVGSVKVFDDQTFEVLADLSLQLNEEGQSIVVATAGDSTAFVVGTTFVDSAEPEPTKGRLLVLAEETGRRAFDQVNEIEIGGCPYALAPAGNGHVAAAVNSQVIVYSIDAFSQALESKATWGGAFVAFNVVSIGTSQATLLVGDALRSVTVLQLTTSPSYKLEETARDYDAHYMSAIEAIGESEEEELIGAETDLNLFTVRKEKTAGTTRSIAVDDTALAPRGVFHLGEMVSKFRRGSLVQQLGDAAGVASPRLIYTTSAGSLGIVAELDTDSGKLLSDLERNMRRVLESVGGLKQEDFRSFKSERQTSPPAGFVDGNFVERFAELSAEEVDKVMEGGSEHERLGVSKAEVLRAVEEMARMH